MEYQSNLYEEETELNVEDLGVTFGIEPYRFEPEVSDTDEVSEDHNTETEEATNQWRLEDKSW